MKNIDLEALKESNPELYQLVIRGRMIRSVIPGVDAFTKNFPIKGTAEKEIFTDAVAGFIAGAAIAAISDHLFSSKKKVK